MQAAVVNCSPLDDVKSRGIERFNDRQLLKLIDHLNLDDLIELAATDKEIEDFIKTRYIIGEYHFDKYPIKIQINRAYLLVGNGGRSITTFEGILRFLRMYGSIVPQMTIISMDGTNPKFHRIGRFIERYCRNTVTKLHVKGEATVLFDQWNSTFDSVTDLDIEYDHPLYDLEKIFPNMHSLSILLMNEFSQDLKIPQLKYFHYRENFILINKQLLANAIQSNPQLERLRIDTSVDATFVNLIENGLPEQLESLEMHIPLVTPEIIDFIVGSKYLARLSLPRATIDHSELTKIVTELIYLEQLEIKKAKLTGEQLVEIMSRNSQLKGFTVIVDIDFEFSEFLQSVPSQWILDESSLDRLNFQRILY